MRTRKEIEMAVNSIKGIGFGSSASDYLKLIMEVLLDIRDEVKVANNTYGEDED